MPEQQAFFLSRYEIEAAKQEGRQRRTGKRSGVRQSSRSKEYNCETCGLLKKTKSGKIERFGQGKKNILMVGLCPGWEEDRDGIPFVGKSGKFLKSVTRGFGIDLTADCIRTNIVACYTNDPTDKQIRCCRRFLDTDIEEIKPKLIICLGGEAINEVLRPETLKKITISSISGKVVPCQRLGCWVGACFHPSFILRGNRRDESFFISNMMDVLEYLNKPLPKPLNFDANKLVLESNEAMDVLQKFSASKIPVAYDYEATTISPYDDDAKLLWVSLSNDSRFGYAIWLANPDWNIIEQAAVYRELANFLKSDAPKVVQGFNMEELWSRRHIGTGMNNFIMDTMVTTHVVNCRHNVTSLGFQTYMMTGHEYKKMVDVANIENEDVEQVANYSSLDSRYTIMAFHKNSNALNNHTRKFNELITRCLPVLANLQERGVRIDMRLLNEFNKTYNKRLEERLRDVRGDKQVQKYVEGGKSEFNPSSHPQMRQVIYRGYGVVAYKKKATGEDVLRAIQTRTKDEELRGFIDKVLRYRKTETFLKKTKEILLTVDSSGFIHPTYNMNFAETFRSSANDPNIQSVPKREEALAEIRRVFIPREGHVFIEPDYKGLEICGIAMVSGDSFLGEEIKSGIDVHSKWARKIYSKAEVSGEERFRIKNGFVFPSFYGSAYESIAKSFPEMTTGHIKKTQDEFWEQYWEVREWQQRTLKFYKENGFILCASGFIRHGPLSDFQLYNTPVQGPCFHLFLDALARVDERMISKSFESMAVAEIHDSGLFDVDPKEVDDVVGPIDEVFCSKRFEWQRDIPLRVSYGVGENWLDMEDI